ncbi:unnamed protein product [Lasius platythorax]|uniref:Uncharacterized protein n=1 Tax=Lasius platythorax TaxID=488582 RepID=A0AAV2N7W6_9HYME
MSVHLSLRRECIEPAFNVPGIPAVVVNSPKTRLFWTTESYSRFVALGYPGLSHGNNDRRSVLVKSRERLAHYSPVVHAPRIRETSGTKPLVGGE